MKLAFKFRGEMGKYQSEKEAALGRGKRLRKAVSYREAYAAHPTETLSKNLGINQGLISILHEVPEGRVGVYWRGGAILKTITDPGFHLKLPLVTHFEPVQMTLQTDQMVDKLDDETMAINFGPPNFKEALEGCWKSSLVSTC